MEQKTKIEAVEGKQEIRIAREFDLPLDLLFKAYEDSDIIEQWMGTKVLKLENKRLGIFQYQTTDPRGNTFGFSGVIHEWVSNQKITRTYEMENTPFPVWLEFLKFESLSDKTSKLSMQMVYKSVEDRDQILQLPFAQGINMAHQRLEKVLNDLNHRS